MPGAVFVWAGPEGSGVLKGKAEEEAGSGRCGSKNLGSRVSPPHCNLRAVAVLGSGARSRRARRGGIQSQW